MAIAGKLAGIGAACVLLVAASIGSAQVQTLVPSGVSRVVDNAPGFGDPILLWATLPACAGGPGDELLPALISRASLSIATPRSIFAYNPARAAGVCNPYRLLSNIFNAGDLYFIDNRGPGGRAGLQRLPRDANPGDAPRLLADLGTINGAALIVRGDSVYAIVGAGDADRLMRYDRDSGALLDGAIEAPATPGTLANLAHDGRFLYWTRGGTLRRYDSYTGGVDSIVNAVVDALYVYGYDEWCDPDGCQALSRIVYSRDNTLFEAETISGQIFPLYTSPVAAGRIRAIQRGVFDYYFIERRPLNVFTGEQRVFRLDISSSTPDLLYGPIRDEAGGIDSLRLDHTWLYFRDYASESLLRLPADARAIRVRDLRATGLEVTQGLQDTRQSVRLLADKRTIARLYVRSGRPEDVPGVTATLSGSNSRGFLGRLEPINQRGKLATVRQAPTRTNLDHSFQFELPRHWTTGGPLTLTGVVNPGERVIEDTVQNNGATRTVAFTPSPRLLVIYYNWSYDLDGARHTPAAADVAASRQRLRRLFPIGEPGTAFESPGLHSVVLDFVDHALADQVDRSNAECVKRYKDAGDRNMCASDYVHGRMAALRRGSGIAADAVSYGNIAQAPAPAGRSYFTRGYASGQIASGPSTDVNYAAHEVGHTLGRDHPFRGALVCGHSATDTDYPYGRSHIAETGPNAETRLAGLDFADRLPGAMTYLDADGHFDIMGYCTPNWISDYTFEGMYEYLTSDARPRAARVGRTAAIGDWLLASGTLLPEENGGGFTLVERTTSLMDATPPAPGAFTLELRGRGGELLAAHAFAPVEAQERPGKLVFDLVVPFVPGTAELVIRGDGSRPALATHSISPGAPTVTDVRLVGAPQPVDGIVTVAWSAGDPDGDPLRFDVYASRAGDPMAYRPVHLGVTTTQVALDTAALGGGQNTLRVVASDGTNTGFADSAAFTVPARPPRIAVTSPVDGAQVDFGQLVALQAEIDDVQDLLVSDVRWHLDGRELGSGRWAQTDELPVGENRIAVTATNSLGAAATVTVTVFVGDRLAPPAAALSVAPQALAWHVAADDDAPQVAQLAVDNHGDEALSFAVTSDAEWLTVDAQRAVNDAETPRVLAIRADPSAVPPGTIGRATLLVASAVDSSDVVAVPVELSRGNVFDRTGEEPDSACTGDCDRDGTVRIDELVRAVNIALGQLALAECGAIDSDGDGGASINELIQAVGAALRGC